MKAAQSARGLFRATGKKTAPVAIVAGTDLVGEVEREEYKTRDLLDFQPTPDEGTEAFIYAEGARLRHFKKIWEPAAGEGHMVRVFEKFGYRVFASDIVDRGCGAEIKSFFDYQRPPKARVALVTNPPFSECNARDGKGRWIWHALDTLDLEYMALLLPWPWPGAAGHAKLWQTHPPARVYLMRWKLDFTGEGAPPMLTGWFVWDRTWQGETVLRMMDRVNAAQYEMFGNPA